MNLNEANQMDGIKPLKVAENYIGGIGWELNR